MDRKLNCAQTVGGKSSSFLYYSLLPCSALQFRQSQRTSYTSMIPYFCAKVKWEVCVNPSFMREDLLCSLHRIHHKVKIIDFALDRVSDAW